MQLVCLNRRVDRQTTLKIKIIKHHVKHVIVNSNILIGFGEKLFPMSFSGYN